MVDVVGVRRYIDIALLQDDPPRVGDWVLVHVGFAMSKVSEADALEQIRTLNALGESELARQEAEGYGSAAEAVVPAPPLAGDQSPGPPDGAVGGGESS